MDIFDVLRVISKRKTEFIRKGMTEMDASYRARLAASKEYHVPMRDIRKICGVRSC